VENKVALLVIDVQKVVTGRDAKIPFGYERCGDCINVANKLIAHAREKGWGIYYVAEATAWHQFIPAAVTHFNFMKGSEGVKFDERLDVVNGHVYNKMFASALSNRHLRKELEAHRFERLVLCGLAADKCVAATARSAIAKGFRVTIASDATIAETDEKAREVYEELEKIGVQVEETSRLLTTWTP
jgi:nicotinamidase-related amidase